MPREPVDKLIERSKNAWAEKDLWRATFQDAYQFAFPGRNLYLESGPGQLKNEHNYDSTLQTSTHRFVNMLQTDMTPVGQKWAKYVPGPLWSAAFGRNPDEVLRAGRMCDDLTEASFALIHGSNFDTTVAEVYGDMAISQGTMLANPGDHRSVRDYRAIPLFQTAVERGAYGLLSAVYRNYKLRARDVEPTWRKLGFNAPAGWEGFVRDKPDAQVDCMEATYYGYDSAVWYYDVLLKAEWTGGEKKYERVVERDFKVNPWIVAPWSIVAGESYGRGPVLDALPDARVLNKTKLMTLQNASLALAPPIMCIDDGVINFSTLTLTPGAPIQVARNDGALGPSLKPLVLGDNFDVAQLVIRDGQDIIRRTMMDESLPSDTGAVRSATEFMARARDRMRNASPRSRIMTDFIRPLFRINLNDLSEMGVLKIIANKHGFDIDTLDLSPYSLDIQVVSPLFQAQNLDNLDSVSAALQLGAALGNEVMILGLKVEELPGYIWDQLGLPKKFVRTEEEREEMQENAAKVMAAQQQQAA